jgi:hypothetical protein
MRFPCFAHALSPRQPSWLAKLSEAKFSGCRAGNILVRPNPSQHARRGWLARLLHLPAPLPRPQLVILDHGLYITLPEHVRLNYCQLWGAFVLGDAAGAQAAAIALGGERAGKLLRNVLRPRDWAAVPKAERRKVGGRVCAFWGGVLWM